MTFIGTSEFCQFVETCMTVVDAVLSQCPMSDSVSYSQAASAKFSSHNAGCHVHVRVQGINRSTVDGKGCGTSHRLRMNADLKGYRLVTSQAFFEAEIQAGRQELAVLHLADTILCGGIDEAGDAPKRPGSQCVLRLDSAA